MRRENWVLEGDSGCCVDSVVTLGHLSQVKGRCQSQWRGLRECPRDGFPGSRPSTVGCTIFEEPGDKAAVGTLSPHPGSLCSTSLWNWAGALRGPPVYLKPSQVLHFSFVGKGLRPPRPSRIPRGIFKQSLMRELRDCRNKGTAVKKQ